MYHNIDDLIGKKIKRIFINEEFLKFGTDQGDFTYTVGGDCCSESVFYDFIGVKKLLKNGAVKAVSIIELTDEEIEIYEKSDKKNYQESISIYGFSLTTEDPIFGEVTSVFSFRNYSNGYYGGDMSKAKTQDVKPEIFDDVIETSNSKDA